MLTCIYCGKGFTARGQAGPTPQYCSNYCITQASVLRRAPLAAIWHWRASDLLTEIGKRATEQNADPGLLKLIHQMAVAASDNARRAR